MTMTCACMYATHSCASRMRTPKTSVSFSAVPTRLRRFVWMSSSIFARASLTGCSPLRASFPRANRRSCPSPAQPTISPPNQRPPRFRRTCCTQTALSARGAMRCLSASGKSDAKRPQNSCSAGGRRSYMRMNLQQQSAGRQRAATGCSHTPILTCLSRSTACCEPSWTNAGNGRCW